MKALIYISDRITKGETLVDVIRQYKSYEAVSEVEVIINSNGGSLSEGRAVRNYLENLDKTVPVTTDVVKAYSIAAEISMAGSTRKVREGEKRLMIHFARTNVEGTAETLEDVASELRIIEDEFVSFYSEKLNLEAEAVQSMLDSETYFSGEEALSLGFSTELVKDLDIVAELQIDNQKSKIMAKETVKKAEKSLMDKFKAFLSKEDEVINPVENIVAELILTDSNGDDIVFPDLEASGVPKVGDKAIIDGVAISDGSYIMPSLEDSSVTFVGGEITEISPKEEEIIAEEEIKEVFTYSSTTTNTSFNVGEILMFEGWDGGDPYAASAGEFKLKDGSTIVTDASGEIVKATAKEVIADPEASLAEEIKKVKAEIKAELSASFSAELAKKDAEIIALKKSKTGVEFKAEGSDLTPQKNDLDPKNPSRYLSAASKL